MMKTVQTFVHFVAIMNSMLNYGVGPKCKEKEQWMGDACVSSQIHLQVSKN